MSNIMLSHILYTKLVRSFITSNNYKINLHDITPNTYNTKVIHYFFKTNNAKKLLKGRGTKYREMTQIGSHTFDYRHIGY